MYQIDALYAGGFETRFMVEGEEYWDLIQSIQHLDCSRCTTVVARTLDKSPVVLNVSQLLELRCTYVPDDIETPTQPKEETNENTGD